VCRLAIPEGRHGCGEAVATWLWRVDSKVVVTWSCMTVARRPFSTYIYVCYWGMVAMAGHDDLSWAWLSVYNGSNQLMSLCNGRRQATSHEYATFDCMRWSVTTCCGSCGSVKKWGCDPFVSVRGGVCWAKVWLVLSMVDNVDITIIPFFGIVVEAPPFILWGSYEKTQSWFLGR